MWVDIPDRHTGFAEEKGSRSADVIIVPSKLACLPLGNTALFVVASLILLSNCGKSRKRREFTG